MNQTLPTETLAGETAPRSDTAYHLATRTAAVAGVFSLIACSLLLYDYSRRQVEDPLEVVTLKTLKAALAEQPESEPLRLQIRTLDRQLRQAYFRRRAFAAGGAFLLIGGVGLFLVAAKSAATLRRKLPMPAVEATRKDIEAETAQNARLAVAVLAVVLLAGAVGLSVALRPALPQSERALAALLNSNPGEKQPGPIPGPTPRPVDATYEPPSRQEVARWWPGFRGPGSSGVSAYENQPDGWDAPSGKNVLWKTAVPLPGNSSPVVWGNRVFLSGADEKQRRVYCFAADSGELLWHADAPGTPQSTAEPPKVMKDTGYAAPTTVTDGHRVAAVFANGDLVALNMDGSLAWSRSLGIPDSSYGFAASPAIHKNLVLVQLDQGSRKDDTSKLYALEIATGEIAWQVTREASSSWGSPIVVPHEGRDQVITCCDPWAISYDLADGKEIWRADCLQGDCGVTPVAFGGVVYLGNEYCQWSAIRIDGEGDVTESHILWSAEDGLPDQCSPLVTREYVFLLATWGTMTCYAAESGELLWEAEFDDASFVSSPSLVGNRIYLFGDEGKAWIVEPSREEGKIVGHGDLGEACVTSPAFQDGHFFIRGKEHLFCIGSQ